MGYIRNPYRGKHAKSQSIIDAENAKKEIERQRRGSVNNDIEGTYSCYSGTYDYLSYDRVERSRSTSRGDFIHTTPYNVSSLTRNGTSFLAARVEVERLSDGDCYDVIVCRDGANPQAQQWGGYVSDGPLRDRLESSSQLALLTKVRKDQASWDILTDAAELRESVELLRSTAQTMSRLLFAVEKRDVRSIANILGLKTRPQNLHRYHRDIYGVEHYAALDRRTPFLVGDGMQNLWMKYRKGFLPMVYSMEDALIALAGPARDREYVFTSQVTLHDSWSASSVSTVAPYNYNNALLDITTSYRTNGSVRKKAYYRFTDGIRQRLVPNLLIALTKTAWELVPLSWMYDWFLGLNTYMDDMQLPDLLADVRVNVSRKGNSYVSESIGNLRMNLPPGYEGSITSVFAPSNGVSTSTWFTFSRESGNIAIPEYSVKEVFYTWQKQLDSSAILWQKNKANLHNRCQVRPRRPF